MDRKINISVYSYDLPAHACAQLRLLLPMSLLKDKVELSWEVKNDGRRYAVTPGSARDADLIIVQRSFPDKDTRPVMEEIFASGKPVVYEADDLFTDMPDTHPLKGKAGRIQEQVLETLKQADHVTVSTPYLKQCFSKLNERITVLPNLLHEGVWRTPPSERGGPVVIGFAGTPTHEADLRLVEEPLARIAEKYGENVRFRFFGCETARLKRIPLALPVPFDVDYLSYARRLPRLGLDLALAPLEDNAFNRAKSNVKWLEYSVAGAAGIYSDLEPYAGSVEPGVTGLLVPGDEGQWFEALDELVGDRVRRSAMARAARERVLADYGMVRGAEQFYQCWKGTLERR